MERLAVVTCGPAHEPVDAVRRITNLATGTIGTELANALARRGWRVVCFRGEGATAPPPDDAEVRVFGTNDSLARALEALDGRPAAVFHAAALCDFGVRRIEGGCGALKLRGSSDRIVLHLASLPKLLPRLRFFFPEAAITGWKFECDGDRDTAITRAVRQIAEARSDACVVNGPAYGPGFGIVSATGGIVHLEDKSSLAAALVERLSASA